MTNNESELKSKGDTISTTSFLTCGLKCNSQLQGSVFEVFFSVGGTDIRSLIDVLDCPSGLVVKVLGYIYRGPGLIPGATILFLRSNGSGTGSTQPRDDNSGAISRK
jgi:hypothetical protein